MDGDIMQLENVRESQSEGCNVDILMISYSLLSAE